MRRHKLIRNRLGEVIAPNRITLNPTDAAALAQTLRTLNYFVELPANIDAPFQHPAQADGVSPALQWFLITLYNGLGIHLSLPIDLPWDVREALRNQLTFQQQAAAEASAQQLLDQLHAALNGYLRLPALHMPPTTDPGPLLRAAITSGHDVELRYWGPATQPNGDGQVSTRRVTPYWIEERHQILYLIGWCHLRQQERVFRLDRIEAVVSL